MFRLRHGGGTREAISPPIKQNVLNISNLNENKPPPLPYFGKTNENKPMGDFTVPLISVKYAFY